MLKRLALAFAIFGLAAASAATYRVTLSQPSKVEGKQLKAGEYRLNVENSKLTIVKGKESVEVPVKVQTGDTKFESTSVRYSGTGDKVAIREIRIGGQKPPLVVAHPPPCKSPIFFFWGFLPGGRGPGPRPPAVLF